MNTAYYTSIEKAEKVAAQLLLTDDDWTAKVEDGPQSGLYVVAMYDEDGEFVGNWRA